MRLTLVIASRVLLVIALVIMLVTFLNYSRFETLLRDVEAERFAMEAEQIGQLAERGLDLGLNVDELGNVEDAIDALAAAVPGIGTVSLLNAAGTAVYAASGTGTAGDEDETPNTVAQPIVNVFGQTAGSVVIEYDRHLQAGTLQASLQSIGMTGLWTALLAALACLAAIYLTLRPLSRSFGRMAGAAEAFILDPAEGGRDFKPGNAMESDYRRFLDAARDGKVIEPPEPSGRRGEA